MGDDLAAAVEAALEHDPAVDTVTLVGSRADGRATAHSDWDFAVATSDFDGLAARLPDLVAPLGPLAAQWAPLGRVRTYLLLLPGARKVDLIFDVPREESPPWAVTPETRPRVDHHFWDWTLWLAGKAAAGNDELVETELARMHRHLLRPLGVESAPATLDEAVDHYLRVREEPSAVERDVLPRLRHGA